MSLDATFLRVKQFEEDAWVRPNGGGGISRVLAQGKVFEKAGVNLSVVYGTMPQEVSLSILETHSFPSWTVMRRTRRSATSLLVANIETTQPVVARLWQATALLTARYISHIYTSAGV